MNNKRTLLCLALSAMILLLTACGEIGKVEKLIDAIGEVTVESGDAISSAQAAYDALEDEDKLKVENASVLSDSHEQYALALKEKDYNDADAAFEAGNFTQAKAIFESLADYKDAANRAVESECADFYTQAQSLFDSGNYVEAAELFNSAAGYADAEEKLFSTAIALFDAACYSDALNAFELSLDSAKEPYVEYAQGAIDLNDGKYESAQKHFEASGGLNGAGEMVNVCVYMQAEENMGKGYLNTAKALYSSLPSDFSYGEGKSVEERLASLEKFNAFVELCGVWKSSNMDASVRQTSKSTGRWNQWDGEGSNYTLEITCVLNEDETATLTAKANFWYYTNYSSLSKNLETANTSCSFTYTGINVPSTLDYSLDFTYEYSGTLTINNKNFTLSYQILNKNSSVYFTYTHKSFGTYDTFMNTL